MECRCDPLLRRGSCLGSGPAHSPDIDVSEPQGMGQSAGLAGDRQVLCPMSEGQLGRCVAVYGNAHQATVRVRRAHRHDDRLAVRGPVHVPGKDRRCVQELLIPTEGLNLELSHPSASTKKANEGDRRTVRRKHGSPVVEGATTRGRRRGHSLDLAADQHDGSLPGGIAPLAYVDFALLFNGVAVAGARSLSIPASASRYARPSRTAFGSFQVFKRSSSGVQI